MEHAIKQQNIVRPIGIEPIRPETGRTLGAILLEAGKLSTEEIGQVLRTQEETGLCFGDAALSLGLLTQYDLDFALARQFDYSYLTPGDGSLTQDLVAAYDTSSATVEQLRRLRSQIVLRWMHNEPSRKGLAITSTERGEGRSFIAANLAILFSQLGKRTLLIDADLRHPRQHELFTLPGNVGLSAILSRRAGLEAIIRVALLSDLSVLPAGPIPPNPQELLGRSQFADLLSEVSHLFDVVIVDTPAWSDGSDLQLISAFIETAVTVIGANRTTVSGASSLVQALVDTRVDVVGAVFNRYEA